MACQRKLRTRAQARGGQRRFQCLRGEVNVIIVGILAMAGLRVKPRVRRSVRLRCASSLLNLCAACEYTRGTGKRTQRHACAICRCIYTYIYIYIYVCVYLYICICICISVYSVGCERPANASSVPEPRPEVASVAFSACRGQAWMFCSI